MWNDEESIKVYVRVRPLTQGRLRTDGEQDLCLTVTPDHTLRLNSKPKPRNFTYDHVADMDVTQEYMFSLVAKISWSRARMVTMARYSHMDRRVQGRPLPCWGRTS
ncbi:kinesin-like protein KIF15 [Ictalurus punctatus]|uniref:Kinesin-like protein KIF15 n=1 Tax=Ictalurus punctatus TaxID=7998 RepID=A0A9F7TJE8_ICTPU|nr:kinesin-like protein KIF15 [Ictalurus punctatus]